MDEQYERMVSHNRDRAAAYRQVFLMPGKPEPRPWWAFWRRARPGPLSPVGHTVLNDLARFCYAAKPTAKVSQVDQHFDPLAMAYAEGRREVYLRVLAMLDLDAAQLDHVALARRTDE